MKYSFDQNRKGVVFAHTKDVNASFKDLGAVCAAIRYRSVPNALEILDSTMGGRPILYRRHNAHMGSRHELGGRKGRTPIKCAAVVRKVLVNAAANATNKGLDPDSMFVVHAAANKTIIAGRGPSKGALFVSGGTYGYMTSRRMDLEFSKVELGISQLDDKVLNRNMVEKIRLMQRGAARAAKGVKRPEKKEAPKKKAIITKVEQKPQPAAPAGGKMEPVQPARGGAQPEQRPATVTKTPEERRV